MANNHVVLQNVVGAGIVGLIAWLWANRDKARASAVADENGDPTSGDGSGFYAPYYTTNPGIADDRIILNGGPAFQSTINVDVGDALYGSLSRQYIPIFGFVGVTSLTGA